MHGRRLRLVTSYPSSIKSGEIEAAMYGTASRVQFLKGDTFITVADAPVELFHSIKASVLPSTKTSLLTNTFEMYARLHITTSVVNGTLEQPCQMRLLARLHSGFSNRWFKIGLLQCHFGWNIRGQPQQTAVCPEYSGPSCHGNSSF